MRVLVTGSSGMLGGAVAGLLSGRHEVVGLDRVEGPSTSVVGGVEEPAAVARAMVEVDAVVHVASLHAPDVGRVDPGAFRAVNVEGTRALLEAAAAAGARRFVYTSTTSVYGAALVPSDAAVWVDETLAPIPRDIYDETKLAAEELCRRFAEERGLPAIVLRAGRFFPERAAVVAAHRLHRGVDLRDVAAAHVLAVDDITTPFAVVNVAARSPFRREDAAELLQDAPAVIRRRCPWVVDAFAARGWPLPATIDRVYDVSLAESLLGYRPAHDLAAFLRDLG
jgi:nucleoside-diphosphate-sugar epimerase